MRPSATASSSEPSSENLRQAKRAPEWISSLTWQVQGGKGGRLGLGRHAVASSAEQAPGCCCAGGRRQGG